MLPHTPLSCSLLPRSRTKRITHPNHPRGKDYARGTAQPYNHTPPTMKTKSELTLVSSDGGVGTTAHEILAHWLPAAWSDRLRPHPTARSWHPGVPDSTGDREAPLANTVRLTSFGSPPEDPSGGPPALSENFWTNSMRSTLPPQQK